MIDWRVNKAVIVEWIAATDDKAGILFQVGKLRIALAGLVHGSSTSSCGALAGGGMACRGLRPAFTALLDFHVNPLTSKDDRSVIAPSGATREWPGADHIAPFARHHH